MSTKFTDLDDILNRTKDEVTNFQSIITQRIENANDEHERLYWHHIYEEEEQRLDRINDLLPKLNYYLGNAEDQSINNHEFVHLLQDISLEKFGLHNFEEHLDLALYWYKDSDAEQTLQTMRDTTSNDYEKIKVILSELNEEFNGVVSKAGSIPTDEKENAKDELKAAKYVSESEQLSNITVENNNNTYRNTKKLTVGSLKNIGG